MRDRMLPVLGVMALVGIAPSLSAHHSTVAYAQHTLTLKDATIKNVVWAHPHIILTFSVKEANGAASTWSTESGSPGSVARLGWNRNSVKPGDKVTIELLPAKNGAHVGRLKKVIFPDGRELLDTQTNPETLKQ
ncbi:MAG TPA: DUF6152 family protein [Terriglobia bacterium]|nr:DUF6152 family protein [Terriglobia bacterium]